MWRFCWRDAASLYDDLRKLSTELGIGDRVFFTMGEGNMMDWLARMSIGCLTSISEGFSNAIMEYMAAGMPVVAIDVGGNRDAVVEGETGFPRCLSARPRLSPSRSSSCYAMSRCVPEWATPDLFVAASCSK